MKKSQTTFLKTFKLKEQTAIEVINSFYSYEHVKFFVELVPDLVQKNGYSNLPQRDLSNIGWLISIMTKLIDSAEMTALLQKFSQINCVQMKPNIPLINSIDTAKRSEILSDEMLEWLNNLPAHKQRKIYTMEAMKDFFTSEFFFNEFTKWLDQVVTDKNITLVELLDAYYNWFPIKPD